MSEPVHPESKADRDPTPRPLLVHVITVSDTRTEEDDKSGQVLLDFVESSGHRLSGRLIVKDELEVIRNTLLKLREHPELEVILLTGGTGITSRDVTPEAVLPLLDKEIPGFGELFRYLSWFDIGAATIQSRALGGVMSKKLVFALPGSPGAVRLAVEKILRPQLDIRTRPCNFAGLLARL